MLNLSRYYARSFLLCRLVWFGVWWSGNEPGLPLQIHYLSSKWAVSRLQTGGPPYMYCSVCYRNLTKSQMICYSSATFLLTFSF